MGMPIEYTLWDRVGMLETIFGGRVLDVCEIQTVVSCGLAQCKVVPVRPHIVVGRFRF